MERDLLIHLPVVLAVARRAGFAAAASELGMSPSAVSHAVRQVEERLGTPLFARTTRSVALTEAGRALVEAAGPALRDIGERVERIRADKGRVGGHLRLNLPSFSLPVLIPVVKAMADRFPDLTVEVFADDAIVDIVASGFDAGARLGETIAEDMVATRLLPPFKAIIAAAPAYLAKCGRPRDIADLRNHSTITFRMITSGAVYKWDLRDGERDVSVECAGPLIVNHALYGRDLALSGAGLVYIFEPVVRADLAAGRLVQVLPETAVEEAGLFLYYPRRASRAPKLRAFIDTAREVLRERG